ncbi:hypothetical protein RHS01_09409 [Rhizoctonia solani]|uniref:Uncharacterized protein n=1 Tax=Rhizoctonia solani TaxID=456999 RepID=A0A8H7I6L2_9AGAM|nr:hypothetical protein RHS01_09409 [Rhizoctonia solani]
MSSDTDSIWVCTRLVKSTDRPARAIQQDGDSKWDTAGSEGVGLNDCEIEVTDQLDDSEGWEIGAGLEEEPAPLWRVVSALQVLRSRSTRKSRS